jgi:hypothetical protein
MVNMYIRIEETLSSHRPMTSREAAHRMSRMVIPSQVHLAHQALQLPTVAALLAGHQDLALQVLHSVRLLN